MKPRYIYYAFSLALLLFLAPIRSVYGDFNLPPINPEPRFWINIILINLLIAYFFVCRDKKTELPRWSWGVFIGVGLLMCFTAPIFSGDVHEYLIRGRVLGVYHENPYLHAPIEFPDDPFYAYSVWRKWPDDYGPVWTMVQWIAPTLFGHSYFSAIAAQKIVLYIFLIGSVWIFYKISKLAFPDEASYLARLLALNPNFIIHHLVDGHNDIVAIFFALAAVYWMMRGRAFKAVVAGAAAALSKTFAPVIMMPVLSISYLKIRGIRGFKAQFFTIITQVTIFFATIGIAYFPFWFGWDTLKILSVSANWFYTNSVPYAFYLALQKVGLGADAMAVNSFFLTFFVIAFIALSGRFYFLKKYAPRDLFLTISFIYLILHCSYSVPFYGNHLNWALPFLILSKFPLADVLLTLYSAAGALAYFKRLSFLYLGGFAIYAAALAITLWRIRGKDTLKSF